MREPFRLSPLPRRSFLQTGMRTPKNCRWMKSGKFHNERSLESASLCHLLCLVQIALPSFQKVMMEAFRIVESIPCKEWVILHDIVDTGTDTCYDILVFRSVENCFDEFGNDSHKVFLCTTGSNGRRSKTYATGLEC